jgi:tetraprenyl-beta-curcumene synthase
MPDPAPLSAAQLQSLVRATIRQLVWGLPAVASEVRRWRTLAGKIPDAALRQDALSALARKRGHTDGAALFWTLPRARNPHLLRVLVAYEIIWDYLDSVNEHGATRGQANGRQLHLALIDALDCSLPISDYYRYHPWHNDGGYLRTLVEVCRAGCARLPSYERVRPQLLHEATRTQVLAINHDPDPVRRDRDLREWVVQECSQELHASWFELSGAASASPTIHALLSISAEPAVSGTHIRQTRDTYFPWVSAVTTMLDSYVDQREDIENGDHSYIAHYRTPELATRQVCRLIQRSLTTASALPNGERHSLIIACMIAMYLSKDSARTPEMRDTTRSLVSAGGSLTEILLPILRTWRIAYMQRSA